MSQISALQNSPHNAHVRVHSNQQFSAVLLVATVHSAVTSSLLLDKRCAECSPLSVDLYQTLMWWNHSEAGIRLIASSWRQFYSFHKFQCHVIEFCICFDKRCSILLDITNRNNTIYCDDCIKWMAAVRSLSLRTWRNSPVTVWPKILETLTQSECF
jgi:hypothetical protein